MIKINCLMVLVLVVQLILIRLCILAWEKQSKDIVQTLFPKVLN